MTSCSYMLPFHVDLDISFARCLSMVTCAVVDMQLLVGMMDDIQKHYAASIAEDGRLWVEGQIAVSQFTDDNLFYRSRVMNVVDADTVEVRTLCW